MPTPMLVLHSALNRRPNSGFAIAVGEAGLDVVAERLEQRGSVAGRQRALVVHRPAERVVVEQADAQPTGVGAQLVDVRPVGRRRR